MQTPTNLLEVHDLNVVHRTPIGDNWILSDISPSVAKGQSIALVGLLPPGVLITAGSMLYEGAELATLNKKQRASYRGDKMTLLFQAPLSS